MSGSAPKSLHDLDTSQIKTWRSIVTLIVFVVTNLVVLFPFGIPIYIPRQFSNTFLDALSMLRIISPRQRAIGTNSQQQHELTDRDGQVGKLDPFVRIEFPMNFITAPLIADLFLLAILAIGRKEVHDGTIGTKSISPLDIMVFFITLAYIAISIDASGLIRYLAFKVLQKGGKVGHRLFFYLYFFFFALGSFIGNDPIILSGTAFLAYMTRVSSNIIHPRAWIHTQFAIANIASAILVSSNPTNLVLAGAFSVKFINYTANMIIPVVATAIVLFPFLLYVVFADESLIPLAIKMHELSEEAMAKKPVNPNIPNARGNAEEEENLHVNDEQGKLLSLEEIMNCTSRVVLPGDIVQLQLPRVLYRIRFGETSLIAEFSPFLDKGGAVFGALIMAVTLVTLLVLNAVSQSTGEHPVFYVTLPAAFVMFCWDVAFGWFNRLETREISRKGRLEIEHARAARRHGEEEREQNEVAPISENEQLQRYFTKPQEPQEPPKSILSKDLDEKSPPKDVLVDTALPSIQSRDSGGHPTLVSLIREGYRWSQETFPTVTAVLAHLPFALVPFAFSMFVLVQALVTKGWVPVFAYGWDHWVNKTGTVGAIGGMGFLSVILCNFAGTNIGTTILLSRVIQAWQEIHQENHLPITNRTFWGTVYAMAVGVNFGAFSTAFSASLAGLLWRDILARKHIHVRRLDFARVNLPIIAIAMAVGLGVLVGQIYVVRDDSPYDMGSK